MGGSCGTYGRMLMPLPEALPETQEKEVPGLRNFKPQNKRKILCAFPRYSYSFGTFNHAFPLMGDVKGFMPPQGILLIIELIPKEWEVKFVDENIRRVTPEEFAWADAVFVSALACQAWRRVSLDQAPQDRSSVGDASIQAQQDAQGRRGDG